MWNKCKNTFIIMIITTVLVLLCSCTNNEQVKDTKSSPENISFVKDFYTNYLNEIEKSDCDFDKLEELKKKALTETMALEMEFRSRHADADMYVMSQDPTGLLKTMTIETGDSNDWVNVSFDTKNEYGGEEKIFKIHVTNVDGEKKIDTIDGYVKRFDKDGKVEDEFRYITKYGNKPMTDELKKEIDDEIKYFKECDENGYIS